MSAIGDRGQAEVSLTPDVNGSDSDSLLGSILSTLLKKWSSDAWVVTVLLRSFNGPEPGGPESMVRKWKRERKKQGPKLWWSKGILLAEMQAYMSLVGWLLSYYTGWKFVNSHNMDSLIHRRLLTLKRVTACLILWPQSWELRVALFILGIGTDKEQRILEK